MTNGKRSVQMSSLEGVCVVVVNWNGHRDTTNCLNALLPSHHLGARIVVVDNGSTDDSVAKIKVAAPWAQLISTGSNLGYSGGNNVGLRTALESGAAFICVLNNDTLPDPKFLQELRSHCLSDDTAMAVSPVITRQDGRTTWFTGGLLEADGFPRHLQPDEPGATKQTPYSSAFLSGCVLFASNDVWRKVGIFDERYFLMFEDVDWSLRARRCGVRLEVTSATQVQHRVSASFQGPAALLGRTYYARNLILFARDHSAIPWWRMYWTRALRPAVTALARRQESAVWNLVFTLLGPVFSVGRCGRLPRCVERLAYR